MEEGAARLPARGAPPPRAPPPLPGEAAAALRALGQRGRALPPAAAGHSALHSPPPHRRLLRPSPARSILARPWKRHRAPPRAPRNCARPLRASAAAAPSLPPRPRSVKLFPDRGGAHAPAPPPAVPARSRGGAAARAVSCRVTSPVGRPADRAAAMPAPVLKPQYRYKRDCVALLPHLIPGQSRWLLARNSCFQLSGQAARPGWNKSTISLPADDSVIPSGPSAPAGRAVVLGAAESPPRPGGRSAQSCRRGGTVPLTSRCAGGSFH